jgi:hypothetical protein
MLKTLIQTTVLLFIFLQAAGQELTGTWEGRSGTAYWRIGIIQIGDSCFGYSYDSDPGFCKVNFVAVYDKKNNRFKGEAISFIARSYNHVLIAANLHYEKHEGDEYLVGRVGTKALVSRILSLGADSYGQLKKISKQVDTTVYMERVLERLKNASLKKDSSVKANTITEKHTPVNHLPIKDSLAAKKIFEDSVAVIKDSRQSIVVKTISAMADSVTIILYDDGEIDGDIVTVFDNGKILINQLSLIKEPYKVTLALPAVGAKHVIELMAENEGSIPPNTAYMLVLAGSERVEVKASSDKRSNAAIVIQRSNNQ